MAKWCKKHGWLLEDCRKTGMSYEWGCSPTARCIDGDCVFDRSKDEANPRCLDCGVHEYTESFGE